MRAGALTPATPPTVISVCDDSLPFNEGRGFNPGNTTNRPPLPEVPTSVQ